MRKLVLFDYLYQAIFVISVGEKDVETGR